MPEIRSRSKRLIPVLLALLFVGPFATAMYMYYYGGDSWRPQGSVAHGILIGNPPSLAGETIPLAGGTTAVFTGKWSLLYVGNGNCADDCQRALYQLRQVRQALGRDMSRIQRYFISTGGTPDTELMRGAHPDLIVIDGNVTGSKVLAALGGYGEADVFVVDPLGNIMMRFPAGTSMKDMHKDLSLLLKASTIG
ncbi:MAG: SCO family protein [Gammaproteobacteria bacterium]|nr:SCO family protein [Gammaproteobacteria bacterium]MCP5139823.1 SCO family protein [Chromatiales bacterium]